jgi:hypothetical protein
MPTETTGGPRTRLEAPPAEATRTLVRTAFKAALATHDRQSGHPYASLVLVAADAAGVPILLLSGLAVHTRNLDADPRSSLLLDGTSGLGDPLAGGRATLIGSIRACEDPALRRRFLSRHPCAEGYAGFGDFRFYAMVVERAHYIGGFGRIVTLSAGDVLEDISDAAQLLAAEAEIIAHMNTDHADALELYATRLAGMPAGAWRLAGIDPAGIDLVLADVAARVPFPERVRAPREARRALKTLAQQARAAGT